MCTASLSVNSLDAEKNNATGPWILVCEYCHWTSLDLDIKFPKPNNIYAQLTKFLRYPASTNTKNASNLTSEAPSSSPKPLDPDTQFTSLKAFYTSQLSKSTASANPLLIPSGEINYNSPSSLARIMSLYTATPYGKKSSSKPLPMRESADPIEGLQLFSASSSDGEIARLCVAGWQGTTSSNQRDTQSQLFPPRFTSDLRPVPTLLRTKRSNRCHSCRHILVKPEAKVQSTRYKIRLVAINYIPTLTLSSFPSPVQPNLNALPPSKPIQFLLTVKNPLFEPIKITLATPSLTPGPRASKVTILCPQFEIGANADKWDEALDASASGSTTTSNSKARSSRAMPSSKPENVGEGDARIAEAGKIWSRGRNWTSVVVEIVCAPRLLQSSTEGQTRFQNDEDEDILEIPIFVRGEWEGEAGVGEMGGSGEKERREKKEVAFWCVLGVGRIADR